MSRQLFVGLSLGFAVASCQPNTTRPPYQPFPEAPATEVRLSVIEVTRRLAEALRRDSIPLWRVSPRDGYLETPWFAAGTLRALRSPALGTRVVRVRAWADPARPGSSQLTIETSYRPVADPSLPERELERGVPPNHPVAVKMAAILKQLVEQYGGAPAQPLPATAAPEESPPAD